MHSSRIRTDRSLTVSGGGGFSLPGGVLPAGGFSLPGGLPGGGYCPCQKGSPCWGGVLPAGGFSMPGGGFSLPETPPCEQNHTQL